MKNNITLIITLIISFIVTAFLYSYLVKDSDNTIASAVAPKMEVLVFNKSLQSSTVLKNDDFKWILWQGEIEDDAEIDYVYRNLDDKKELDYSGYVLKTNVSKGQMVFINMISKQGEEGEGSLSMIVSPGKRAISIPIREVYSGLSGLVFTGDRVDLMFSYSVENVEASTKCHASQILIENIKVLSTDSRLNKIELEEGQVPNNGNGKEPAENITLEVSIEQAKKIALALKVGEISLTLRNPKDKELTNKNKATTQSIFPGNGVSYLRDCDSNSTGIIFRGN
jgi:pilus assembly protein CpaB